MKLVNELREKSCTENKKLAVCFNSGSIARDHNGRAGAADFG